MLDILVDGHFLLRYEYIPSKKPANTARIFGENFVVLPILVKKGCCEGSPRLFRVKKSL